MHRGAPFSSFCKALPHFLIVVITLSVVACSQETDDAKGAAPATSANQPTVQRGDLDFSTIGQPTCDEFIQYAKQCFANAKAHASAVAVLEPGYREHFKLWGRMQADPTQHSMLAMMCEQHLSAKQSLADGLLCE